MKSEGKKQRPLVERAGLAVFWNTAFFPLKVLIGFASSIVVVRLLRIEGFALFNITTALLNLLGLFSDLGIERTLPRFYPEVEMRYGRRGVMKLLLTITLVKGVVLLLLLLALALAPDFWIRQFDLGPSGSLLLVIIGVLLVLGAISDVTIQLLYTHFRQKSTNLLDVLARVVYPTLTAAFVLIGWGVVGALFALLITTVVSVGVSLWMSIRLLRTMSDEPHPAPESVKRPSTRSLRDRLVAFAGLNYLINWSVWLYDQQFLVLAISLLLVNEEARVQVALISLAYKFTKEFLRALLVPLTGVQTPLFARLYAEGRIEGLRTAYATITKFLLLALVPAGVGLVVVARNVLQVFYGQIGRDAVLTELTMPTVVACTAILAVGLFGEAMISVALNVLMVYENYRAVIMARLVSLISIPLLLILVPELGAVGAAIAAATAGLASRGVALIYGISKIDLVFPGRFFVKVGTASALMGYVLLPVLALLPPTIPSTLLMVTLGVLVFFGAFKLMGGMDAADKERFRSVRLPFSGVLVRFL